MANFVQNYNGGVQFKTGASQGLTVDIDGNIGVGTTPSAWATGWNVIDIGNKSFISQGGGGDTLIGNNWYQDISIKNRYKVSSVASGFYNIYNGVHSWNTAPSGIAGATTTITSGQAYTVTVLGASTLAQWQAFFSALSVLPTVGQSITATATGTLLGGGTVTQVITFNTAMTLDANGNVGIGINTPLSPLHIYKENANDTTKNRIQISRYFDGRGASLMQAYRTDSASDDLMIAVDSVNSNDLTKTKYRISSNGEHKFYGGTTSQERMRIDSSGNVSIGTTTPSGKLSVMDTNGGMFIDGTNVTYNRLKSHTTNIGTDKDLLITTSGNGTSGIYVNTSGNVGIGVTPSAWNGGNKAIQLGYSGGIYAHTSSEQMAVFSNAYRTSAGGYVYQNNGYATIAEQVNGMHQWYTAPSGTAGNAITWTKAMALDTNSTLTVNPGASTNNARIKLKSSQNFGPELMYRASDYGSTITLPYDNGANQKAVRISSAFTKGMVFRVSTNTQSYGDDPESLTYTDAMILNNNGNLGINVTPGSWSSTRRSIDIGGTASTSYGSINSDGLDCNIMHNTYHNGTNYIRVAALPVTRAGQYNGAFTWSSAATGTAGSTVTLTDKMVLDVNGNLTVTGTISSNGVTIGTLAEFTAALG